MMDMSIVESDTQIESDDEILEGSYFEERPQFNVCNSALTNFTTPMKVVDKYSIFYSPMSVDGTPYREASMTVSSKKDYKSRSSSIPENGEDDGENVINETTDSIFIERNNKSKEESFYNGSFDVIDASLNEDANCTIPLLLQCATSHLDKRTPLSEISNNSTRLNSAEDNIRNDSESIIIVDSSDESFSNNSFSIKDKNLKKLINDSKRSKISFSHDVSKSSKKSLSAIDNTKENLSNKSKSIIILDSDDDADFISCSSNNALKVSDRNSDKSSHLSLKNYDINDSSDTKSYSEHFVAEEWDSDCMEVSYTSNNSSSETYKKERNPTKSSHMYSYIEQQLKDKKFVPDINSLGIVDNQLSFLSSLSDKTYGLKCDPVAEFFKLHFRTAKTSLARHLYYIFNELVFDNQLPKFMPLKWSGKLKTASGITTTKFEADPEGNAIFIAYITLSKKIITTAERLRDTLVHEMCHAAVWIINHASDSHGTLWKLWSLKARLALPELPAITRCHSYEINYKYIYKCKDCGYRIGRSRPSNKLLERSLCGYCGGRFRLCEDEQKE